VRVESNTTILSDDLLDSIGREEDVSIETKDIRLDPVGGRKDHLVTPPFGPRGISAAVASMNLSSTVIQTISDNPSASVGISLLEDRYGSLDGQYLLLFGGNYVSLVVRGNVAGQLFRTQGDFENLTSLCKMRESFIVVFLNLTLDISGQIVNYTQLNIEISADTDLSGTKVKLNTSVGVTEFLILASSALDWNITDENGERSFKGSVVNIFPPVTGTQHVILRGDSALFSSRFVTPLEYPPMNAR
jgi:hypothetical protein